MTDFASAQSELASQHASEFAEIAKKLQMDTMEVLMAAGKEVQDTATEPPRARQKRPARRPRRPRPRLRPPRNPPTSNQQRLADREIAAPPPGIDGPRSARVFRSGGGHGRVNRRQCRVIYQ